MSLLLDTHAWVWWTTGSILTVDDRIRRYPHCQTLW